jgi:hypothetical protein
MVKDLSYIHDLPSEALEAAITQAVEEQCLKAIVNYLEEVATTMDTQGIETLNSETLRAMSAEFKNRLEELTNEENQSSD